MPTLFVFDDKHGPVIPLPLLVGKSATRIACPMVVEQEWIKRSPESQIGKTGEQMEDSETEIMLKDNKD